MRILRMSNPTLRDILESRPDEKISKLPIVKRALTMANALVAINKRSTTTTVLRDLEHYQPDILKKTIYEIIQPSQPKGIFHECKTVVMWVMLVIISLAYAAVNIYMSLKTNQILDWDTMFLTLVGPILVVLYDRGVISKENREMLNVLTGGSPAITFMEAINQRIANGPRRNNINNSIENSNSKDTTNVDDY